ncbi:hypothetical protein YC2023_084105 [Brassica napus]
MNGNSRRESEIESSSSLASQDPPCILFASDSLRRRTTVTLKMLETEFPVFNVILKNYPPPAPESLLPKVAPVAQMGVTLLIVCGEHIFPMIRIFDPPAWYFSLRANRFGSLASLCF